MQNPILSILIPTVVGREEKLINLLSTINKQIDGFMILDRINENLGIDPDKEYWEEAIIGMVEIMICKDNKNLTIGEKREKLYKYSNGLFSWQIDDDDSIAPNAIELILEAIKSSPEIPCITFREKCVINGEYKSSNHSIRYSQWMDNQDGYSYVRCPFYKDVIRTNIAKSVPFPHIRYNEDEQWSMAIKHLLTDEIHIEEELYHYIYNETNHNTRYGITND